MYYVKESIKDCVRIFPPQGRAPYLRLDMNENPEGLPKKYIDEVLGELTPDFLATYPEPDVFVEKYAAYCGAEPKNICTTNGSDAAIRYIMEVFVEPGKNVVTVTPSFEMYGVNCAMLGLKHKPVSYQDDFTVRIEDIVETIDEDTDMVALLNPNNPIGTVYTEEEVDMVIKKADAVGAIVVIDEAYHYFYKNTFIEKALKHENVLVLRTFSKLCSLAALRLGIIIGNPTLIQYIIKARPTFEVNAVALKFGEYMMDHPEILDYLMSIENEGRKFIKKMLEENDYEYMVHNGNYVFIKPKKNVALVKEALKDRKILVKTYNNELLKDWIRVNTGSVKVMNEFFSTFHSIDREDN